MIAETRDGSFGSSQYDPWMEQPSAGELVTFSEGGPAVDGIVFDTPSRSKVVVALVHPTRGPGFRTVHPKTLTERPEEGPDDRALQLLIRRTPPPSHGTTRGGSRGGQERPGHARGAMHRTTGK
jgi:hypothetical protein